MTKDLIERIDVLLDLTIEYTLTPSLLKDIKAELESKDAEIERQGKLIKSNCMRLMALPHEKTVVISEDEYNKYQRIKSISVEHIKDEVDDAYDGLHGMYLNDIAQAIHNLINGDI